MEKSYLKRPNKGSINVGSTSYCFVRQTCDHFIGILILNNQKWMTLIQCSVGMATHNHRTKPTAEQSPFFFFCRFSFCVGLKNGQCGIQKSHTWQIKGLIFGTIMFWVFLFKWNRQQLANVLPINRQFPPPSEVVFFLIRPHFLAAINSSRLSRWPSTLNTYSTVSTLLRLGCARGESYIVWKVSR